MICQQVSLFEGPEWSVEHNSYRADVTALEDTRFVHQYRTRIINVMLYQICSTRIIIRLSIAAAQ